MTPLEPAHDDPQWLSPEKFALLYRRTPRRVQQMCQDGEMLDWGMRTYRDHRGRWWIAVPDATLASPHLQ